MSNAKQKASVEAKDEEAKVAGPDQRTKEPNELSESSKAKLDDEGKLDDRAKLNEGPPASEPQVSATAEDAPKKAKKKLYTLSKAFWDGRVLHARGDQVYFTEGTAPRGSTLVE